MATSSPSHILFPQHAHPSPQTQVLSPAGCHHSAAYPPGTPAGPLCAFSSGRQAGDSESQEKALSTSPKSLAGSAVTQILPKQQHQPPCLANAGTPYAISRCSGLIPQPADACALPVTARKTQETYRKISSPAVADTSSATAYPASESVTAKSAEMESLQNTTPASNFERSYHPTPPQQQQQQQPAQWPLAAATVATDISNWLVGGMTSMTSPLRNSSPQNSLHKQG